MKKGTTKDTVISTDVLSFDKKEGALSEKYDNNLPRVLVAFGKVERLLAYIAKYKFHHLPSHLHTRLLGACPEEIRRSGISHVSKCSIC